MKFGFSGEAFANLIVISAFVMIIAVGLIGITLHKKGVDVTKHKVGLTVGIGCLLIFGIIPFWFTELSILDKFILTAIAVAFAVGNYFAIDKMQRTLKEHFGDKGGNP